MKNLKKITEWEVLTPLGWSNFDGIKKIEKNCYIKLKFDDNSILECSENHRIKLVSGLFIYVKNVKKGMVLIGKDNKNKKIISKRKIKTKTNLYDLIEVEKNKEFYSNDVVSHNCAFIKEMDELWSAAQPTLSTTNKGKAILLSTPDGVGNFFHKTWVNAENKKNDFYPIKLPWDLRPDRDEDWKNKQIKELGLRMFGQECNCDFLTSGTNIIELLILKEYEERSVKNNPEMGIKEPIEFRYAQCLWIFEYFNKEKDYIISADSARGDGLDYSAAHVLELDTLTQVAEYQGKVSPKEFGDILVTLAMEYNDALLAVERTGGLGYAVLQQIINREYNNTFYSSNDFKIVDVHRQMTNKWNREDQKLLPGFETSISTRPLIISKLESYFRERSVNVRSIRTINELKTFVWENGKAQAAENYNDDLCMSLGMGLWIRDTALRLRDQRVFLTKAMLDKIHINQSDNKTPIYTARTQTSGEAQWKMKIGNKPNETEDLTWLLR